MALAIKLDDQVRQGVFRDYAEIARVGYVTRARLTQIMNLLNLAPDLQQELLERPLAAPASERNLRKITAVVDWAQQRHMWDRMKAVASGSLLESERRAESQVHQTRRR